MPAEHKGKLLGSIVVSDPSDWKPLYFTPNTCHFVEANDRPYYTLSVKFRFPKDSTENIATLSDVETKKYIVEFTDLNGNRKVAGRPGEACVIYDEIRDNGQNKRDSNHFNCVITLKRLHRIPNL